MRPSKVARRLRRARKHAMALKIQDAFHNYRKHRAANTIIKYFYRKIFVIL